MTRFLLDTNIISNVVKSVPSPHLLAWLADRADGDLFVSTMTLAEIWRGILELPAGRRRSDLECWFAGAEGPAALFAGRILPFDAASAPAWGDLMAQGRRAGRPRSALDMIVAGVAIAHHCIVVTDNERDFEGLEILNPLRFPERR